MRNRINRVSTLKFRHVGGKRKLECRDSGRGRERRREAEKGGEASNPPRHAARPHLALSARLIYCSLPLSLSTLDSPAATLDSQYSRGRSSRIVISFGRSLGRLATISPGRYNGTLMNCTYDFVRNVTVRCNVHLFSFPLSFFTRPNYRATGAKRIAESKGYIERWNGCGDNKGRYRNMENSN